MSSALLLSACGGGSNPSSKTETTFHLLEKVVDSETVNAGEFINSLKENFHKNKKYYGAKVTLHTNKEFMSETFNIPLTDTLEYIAVVNDALVDKHPNQLSPSYRQVYSYYLGEHNDVINFKDRAIRLDITSYYYTLLGMIDYNDVTAIERFTTIKKHQLYFDNGDQLYFTINFSEDYYITDMKVEDVHGEAEYHYSFAYFNEDDLVTNYSDTRKEVAYTYIATMLSKTMETKDYRTTFDGTFTLYQTGRGGLIMPGEKLENVHFEQPVSMSNEYNYQTVGTLIAYNYNSAYITKGEVKNSNIEDSQLTSLLSQCTDPGMYTYPNSGNINPFQDNGTNTGATYTYSLNPLTITVKSGYRELTSTYTSNGLLSSFHFANTDPNIPADYTITYQ